MADKSAEEQKANCPFCKIASGEFPAKVVFEDDKIIAVLDINPAVKGHVLVLPKEHYPFIGMLPENIFSHLFEMSAEISKCIEEAMLCPGVEWFIASGGAAGQQVAHFILHLVPRNDNDGLDNFELKEGNVGEEELKQLKEKIEEKISVATNKKTEKLTKEKLLEVIEKSPQLKQAMIEKPDDFKKMAESTPQLKAMFSGFDIDEIIKELKGGKKEAKQKTGKKSEEKKEKSGLDEISKLFK